MEEGRKGDGGKPADTHDTTHHGVTPPPRYEPVKVACIETHSSHSEGGHCPLSLSGPAPAPTVHLSELGVPTPEWTFHSVELGRPALALE